MPSKKDLFGQSPRSIRSFCSSQTRYKLQTSPSLCPSWLSPSNLPLQVVLAPPFRDTESASPCWTPLPQPLAATVYRELRPDSHATAVSRHITPINLPVPLAAMSPLKVQPASDQCTNVVHLKPLLNHCPISRSYHQST